MLPKARIKCPQVSRDGDGMIPGLRTYSVSIAARRPLVDFIAGALSVAGCKIVRRFEPDRAPFVVVFETPTGERMGIVAYAFLATRTPTRHRPADERSFQIKYGSKADYVWRDNLDENGASIRMRRSSRVWA
jgi:hypothetical protein